MAIFWEKSENEKYWVYRLKHPILLFLSSALFISWLVIPNIVIVGISEKILFIFLGLLVSAPLVIGLLESNRINHDIKTAKSKGKEVIIKKRVSIKNPIEKWIEK